MKNVINFNEWLKVHKMVEKCHDTNLNLKLVNGEIKQEEYNFLKWDSLSEIEKGDIINKILILKNDIVNDENYTPEKAHDIWVSEMLDNGWVYGDKLDSEKRTHPSLKNYEELDSINKLKDINIISIVKEFIDSNNKK